jgi:hypothetical protein
MRRARIAPVPERVRQGRVRAPVGAGDVPREETGVLSLFDGEISDAFMFAGRSAHDVRQPAVPPAGEEMRFIE